ncbi:ATP-dependent DNA helicase RecQ [Spirosomataceae bacterium TFI 002]|nr:ATP-dependent DNA helicase RecQ [Spirosomataceae bacterium TFI 002]
MTKNEVLKKHFGYDNFRPLQGEIINHVLAKNDALVLMPTGGGKSICFQVPALLFEGLTIVISPLIALMKDQVEALRGNGIKASFLNSSLSQQEQDAVLWAAKLGELKLLYIAPEKLFQGNLMSRFKDFNISLFAIDESHCISSWGHDFRPEYRQLSIIKKDFPKVPVIALTATADKVTRRDICKQLEINEEHTFLASFDRPNISLEVLPGRLRMKQILNFLDKVPDQSGIIYCLSRKGTESVAGNLIAAGYKADYYHAGLPAEERSRVQERFIKDDMQIIVATIAFGMGIDKSNIRWILHYNLPSNVESFYQEIGRAGRDGEEAQAKLFYSYADIINRQRMIDDNEMPKEQKEMMTAKLERMKQYAEANICRRRILLSYFNEEVTQDCGNCDVCKNPRTRFDGTVIAQKALSGIARTHEKVAMGMLIDVLRGSRNRNVLNLGYDQIKTFGVGHDLRYEEWMDYLSQLLNSGCMDIAYDEGHSYKLNSRSLAILKGEENVELSAFISVAERKAREDQRAPQTRTKTEIVRGELFEILRTLRKQIADSLGIPPYLVFNDRTLSDMAEKKPISNQQLLDVSGVGEEKLRRYGKAFLDEIATYLTRNAQKGSVLGKGKTYDATLLLFNEGKNVEEISEARKMSPTTILGHLIKLKELGNDIDLRSLIDDWSFDAISKGIKDLKMHRTDPAKLLFEHLGGDVDYGKIRLTMTIYDWG